MKQSRLFLLGTVAVLSALCIIYWACEDPTGAAKEPKSSSQALNDSESQKGPSAQKIERERARTSRASELVDNLRPYMISSNVDDVTVKWNYSDNIRLFWGDGLTIDLSRLGCGLENSASSIICFLNMYSSEFGVDVGSESLRFIRERRLKNGSVVFRFKQYIGSYPVWGTDVSVTVDSQGHLTRIYSHYIKGLTIRQTGYSSLEDLYAAADNEFLVGKIREKLSNSELIFHSKESIVFVNMEEQSTTGIPTLFLTVEDSGGELIDTIIDAETGEIYQMSNRKVGYAAKQIDKTRVSFEDFTTTGCGLWDLCRFPLSCSYDMSPKSCVNNCTTDSECNGAYSDWKCWTSGTFPYYCYRDGLPGTDLTIHDTNGWVLPAYSYNKRFADLKVKMDNVIAFHYDDLGRNSWNGSEDGHDADYLTILNSHCCSSGEGCYFSQECRPGYSDGSSIVYSAWSNLAQDTDFDNSSSYNELSHEWSHCIIYEDAGGWLIHDCLNENLAQMYGSLLAVDMVGGSSTRWNTSCEESASVHRSPWDDEPDGLNGGCMWIPYSQRSRFDWFDCETLPDWGDTCTSDEDCPPYEKCMVYVGETKKCTNNPDPHHNKYIWTRFIRVLAEGPDTFENDGNNEDVGVSFTAVGWSTATDIVYEATTNLSTNSHLEDWVDLVISSGSSNNKLWEVRKALGVVGFLSYTGNPTGAKAYGSFYKHYFSAWTLSLNKYFYAWRDFYSIKVLYVDSGGWTTDTISANTDSDPTVVEYNNRLYIFWRNKLNSGIYFKYYEGDGNTQGPFNLGNLGIETNGEFDSAAYNNNLYLIYSAGEEKNVYLSKCTATTCSTLGWYDYGDEVYQTSLGYTAYAGMGATAASCLNGTGAVNRLYIASPDYSFPYGRIRIDQVDTSDSVTHTSFIPANYPSYKTTSPIGIRAVYSAFPSATTYLYLAWKDLNSTRIYTSVVQKYDDNDDSDTWITRSADTFLDSYCGVRFLKGNDPSYDHVEITHVDTDDGMHYSYLYGRY